MKRFNRISTNAVCIIPRTAIASIMLVMAVLTIFSFISIEVGRILRQKELTDEKVLEASYNNRYMIAQKFNATTNSHSLTQVKTTTFETTSIPTADNSWNLNVIDGVLSDNPLCSNKLFLLVLIVSAPENFEQRDAIRKTWANSHNENYWLSGIKTKKIFLIGRSSNRFLNALLKSENNISGDILLGEYLDTYRNLTMKVVHGFTWAASRCRLSYVLKTDDDCFVNLPLLLNFLWKLNPIKNNLYAGKVRWSSPVIRDPNSRWYVSNLDFRASRFVPYVSGAGYVLSWDALQKFVIFSEMIGVFPNEDAFVGTVLNMAGIRPTYSGRFVTQSGTWQVCNFLYLFVIHHVKPTRQNEYQEMAKKAYEECSREDMATDWV